MAAATAAEARGEAVTDIDNLDEDETSNIVMAKAVKVRDSSGLRRFGVLTADHTRQSTQGGSHELPRRNPFADVAPPVDDNPDLVPF